ncbi:MAG: hypothetical protein LASZOEIN_000428 [Candidatus Fervidibacter sp.]
MRQNKCRQVSLPLPQAPPGGSSDGAAPLDCLPKCSERAEKPCRKLLQVMCGEGLEFGGKFADDRRDRDGWVESDEFEVRVSCQPVGHRCAPTSA